MTRRSLIPATLFTLMLTGMVCSHSSWLASHPSRTPANHAQVRAAEPFATNAAWRWRNAQPAHWRACLLQH